MILDEIVAHKKKEVAARRSQLADLRALCRNAPATLGFLASIRRRHEINIIAEVKRATPGLPKLAPKLDAVKQAQIYEEAGARAISCLTDEEFFKTSLDDLRQIRRGVALPILRKDFIIDEFQILESRARLADAILLIVAILERGQIRDFIGRAAELGLDVLVEAHSEEQLETALDGRAPIVGINNRDLRTFECKLQTSILLRRLVPAGTPVVTESGIQTRDDMKLLDAAGFDAALIGEALIAAPDPKKKIRELLGRPS